MEGYIVKREKKEVTLPILKGEIFYISEKIGQELNYYVIYIVLAKVEEL